MSYIILITATFLLFSGFLVLAGFETRRGIRLFAVPRTRFDRQVSRMTFIIRHIDWAGFISHIAKVVFERAAHDIVHVTLVAVRATERTLTRIIRTLRERVAQRSDGTLPDEGSPLFHTLIRFRKSRKPESKK